MAYQGCKIRDNKKRKDIYKWIEDLEFNMLGLPRADIKIFLHMDYQYSKMLMKARQSLDNNEKDETYLELANLYDFKVIECIEDKKLRSIGDISQELFDYILKNIE